MSITGCNACFECSQVNSQQALFLKLAETIEVVAVFRGFSGVPADDIELPEWKKLD